MESGSSRQEDAALPWAPSEAKAFRRYVAAAASARPLEVSPSAAGNGASVRLSSLHGVRRKPVCLGLLLPLLPHHQIHGNLRM